MIPSTRAVWIFQKAISSTRVEQRPSRPVQVRANSVEIRARFPNRYPEDDYDLDLTDAYDRMVARELLRLASEHAADCRFESLKHASGNAERGAKPVDVKLEVKELTPEEAALEAKRAAIIASIAAARQAQALEEVTRKAAESKKAPAKKLRPEDIFDTVESTEAFKGVADRGEKVKDSRKQDDFSQKKFIKP